MDVRSIYQLQLPTHIMMMEFVDKNGRLPRVPVIIDVQKSLQISSPLTSVDVHHHQVDLVPWKPMGSCHGWLLQAWPNVG